jgi:hypothetical protein
MTLSSGRLSVAVLFGFAVAGCAPDAAIKPNVVSYNNTGSVGAPPSTNTQSGATLPVQQSQGQYYIEFRSRYALSYGHTYVIFGRLDKSGKVLDREVAGLHPASDSAVPYVLGHYIPVPAETGVSDGDLDDRYRSASWRVTLNEAEYRKVVTFIHDLQKSSHYWQATVNNCNNFVGVIARSMGYKTPGIWLRPQQFVTRLREMNGGPNAVGYTGPAG